MFIVAALGLRGTVAAAAASNAARSIVAASFPVKKRSAVEALVTELVSEMEAVPPVMTAAVAWDTSQKRGPEKGQR